MKNIIDAIAVLVKRKDNRLSDAPRGSNRINAVGYALEDYIKNLFADTFDCSESDRRERLSSVFSYLGNDANPPDIMIKGGDAIEVKKIQSDNAALALNSSYPKHTLLSSSPLLSNACREAESWIEKDIIYAVGVVGGDRIKHLCMIYGRDYCASEECYDRIRTLIKFSVENSSGLEFAPTRELGRVNRVDPLGITYLRIRGMWHIENPWRVFDYVYQRNFDAGFNFMCIVNADKWLTFDNRDELIALQKSCPALRIADVKIYNPDNPARLNNAKLISYEF